MAVTKQFTQLDPINNGTTAADNFKLSDAIPAQHTDLTGGVNKLVHRTLAQSLCEPVAVCNSNNPSNGAYTATCQNYPDFALSYQDAQQNTQYLIGLKIRVIFTYGITYGSVSGGTYPTLNINGSGAIPMLAQGKTMASGAASAGQTLEFTVIPYGNGVAFDADSNVRESTSDYTIYTDGSKKLNETALYNLEYKTGYNCDNAYEVGKIKTYIISGSNLPSDFSGGAFVISICNPSAWSANNYIVQIAFDATNTYNYTFFTRKHAAGGWTVWVKWGGAT